MQLGWVVARSTHERHGITIDHVAVPDASIQGDKTRVKYGSARTVLIQAALKSFGDCGYRGTTTKDIAVAAGVSETLIFRYFESKAGLMAAAVVAPLEQILDDFLERWSGDVEFRAQPGEVVIRAFVAHVAEIVEVNPALAQAALSLMVERPPEMLAGRIVDQVSEIFDEMTPVMEEFSRLNDMPAEDAAYAVRIGVISVISNVLALRVTYGGTRVPPFEDRVDHLASFATYGLRGPRAGAVHR